MRGPSFRSGNATNLPIQVHATDTHGVTLINFALFDLVGKQLSPRIRDLGKITLVRDDAPTEITRRYPHAGPLLSPGGTPTWSPNAGPTCCASPGP